MAQPIKKNAPPTGSVAPTPSVVEDRWRRIARYAAISVIVLGVTMRILYLDARPLHHDEAIHATLSFQAWENPEKSTYRYDPTYHGPFLYTVLSHIFPTFGVGIAQARLFPLFFGLLDTFTPLLLIPWIGNLGAWIAVLLLSVAPLFTYYSRFLAHDMPSIFFMVTSVACFLRYRQHRDPRWLYGAAALMGVLFSVKAVGFLYCFMFLTFGMLYWVFDREHDSPAASVKAFVGDTKPWFTALACFCVAYGFFQTSLFKFPDAFVEGLFTKVFSYWWGQHSIERVKGPVSFHLRSLALHDLPVLLSVLAGLSAVFMKHRFGKAILAVTAALFLAMVPWSWNAANALSFLGPVVTFFKIQTSGDLFTYLLCALFGLGGAWAASRWTDGPIDRKVLSFLVYWCFASLAIYSYVGEKVPWLATHVSFPFTILASVFLAYWAKEAWPRLSTAASWKRAAVGITAGLALLYQARIAYLVTFLKAGEPTDLLSQVHNTKDVNFVMDWMKRISFETGDRTEGISLAIVGQPVWAFYFHLIDGGYKKFVLDAKSIDGTQRFAIVDEKTKAEIDDKMQAWGYRLTKLNHSGWWVPEHGTVTWADWFAYAWSRRPATPTGITPMFVYFKPLEVPAVRATASVSAPLPSPKK